MMHILHDAQISDFLKNGLLDKTLIHDKKYRFC